MARSPLLNTSSKVRRYCVLFSSDDMRLTPLLLNFLMDSETCWFAPHVLLRVYFPEGWKSSAKLRDGITCFWSAALRTVHVILPGCRYDKDRIQTSLCSMA